MGITSIRPLGPTRSAALTLLGVAALLNGAAALAGIRIDSPPGNDPGADPDDALSPAMLDAAGAIIGELRIENCDIFDLDLPEENKAFYRLANRLHARTKPEVIRQQLLFSPGEPFSAQQIEESERILRRNHYIHDATIEPVGNEDGQVDILIRTTDVWTLTPRLSFSRSGGTNSSAVGIKDTNLLGRGIEVEALYRSDVDRDTQLFQIADPQFRNSWYGLNAQYENNSDGDRTYLEFGKPFYALTSRSAHGIFVEDRDRIDSLYDRGEITGQFRHTSRNREIFAGWSSGLRDGWSRRYFAGLGLDEHRFSAAGEDYLPIDRLPADRRFVYPFLGVEWIQDAFRKLENLDQIRRTEDRFLGTAFRAQLGLASTSLDSGSSAWLFKASARTSFGNPDNRVLALTTDLAGRWAAGTAENLLLRLGGRYYKRRSDRRLFFAELSGEYGHKLDADQQILLGGDSGLRGYPLRFQAGDKRVLLTLEERLFTDWYPFRLFRVGGAVFFDAGRAWGSDSATDGGSGVLKDIGLGLRIGNPRAGRGHMTHIDLAFPLDGGGSINGVQLVISTRDSF
jgi:hypothetical protein